MIAFVLMHRVCLSL